MPQAKWLWRPEAKMLCSCEAAPFLARTNPMSLPPHVASQEDIMRMFDITPYHRSTIGFDRLFTLLDQAHAAETAPAYPPYNIERLAENDYRITVAVAGFTPDELNIETRDNTLVVRGEKQATETSTAEVLHQGIAARAFERRFHLADNVFATGANVAHGLLSVNLTHEVPEAKKPRMIPIGNGSTVIEQKTVTEPKAKKAA
jgi:molecular chaperone IbpA